MTDWWGEGRTYFLSLFFFAATPAGMAMMRIRRTMAAAAVSRKKVLRFKLAIFSRPGKGVGSFWARVVSQAGVGMAARVGRVMRKV